MPSSGSAEPDLHPGRFDVLDVSSWETKADEQMGSKPKVWLESPGEESYLFKYVRQDSIGSVYGDDWAEKLAAELAHLLGVPAADVELATRHDDLGVVCRRVNDPRAVELAHGNELLGATRSGYDMDLKREHPL